MPPKKAPGPSKKNVEKKKEKLVEDKTFGLKNKNKSKNVQKYIQEVTKQVKGGNTRADRLKEQQLNLKKAKAEIDPLKALFAASITQPKNAMRCLGIADEMASLVSVDLTSCDASYVCMDGQLAPGVDPKSVLCAFHKAGVCTKGNRCKYSHDLNVEKKSAKINLYSDARDDEKAKDKMDTWDQSKLESVVAEKHGDKAAKQTDIVCKHFLDAIERSLYGWFWVCPNGGTACKYRHALPPGYVFKTRAEREAEKSKKVEEISIEEIIEQQRAKLGPSGGTPVTAETLAKWKADKIARKKVEEEKRRKEELKKTGGRGIMSGRALFTFDPTLFRDDADADEDKYSQHDPNEERDDSDSDGEGNGDGSDDDDEEEKPVASSVDAAAAVMDKSLYLQDAEDLDSLKE